ncbi:MAG: sugar phosphate isomerase/epimerase family protein [Acidobacteriota bacterium]
MMDSKDRREFMKQSLAGAVGTGLAGSALAATGATASLPPADKTPRFKISLAGWSLHRAVRANLVKMLDFPQIARRAFGLDAIEPVNTLFEVPTHDYVRRLKKNAEDEGVKVLLIMCDSEGPLAHREKAVREKAVRNHHKWVDIAAELGCHSIRVNMQGEDKENAASAKGVEDFVNRAAESFVSLCEYAAAGKINVIVENHGGLSSNADVMVRVMKAVRLPNFGTLPDFGNFPDGVDRYEGIRKLMPFAKGVSAKAHRFDAKGNEADIDYDKMMNIVLNEGKFSGYIDIEYEGDELSEYQGILATKRLLERYQSG